MAIYISVNVGPGNGLLPDGTKPLPEPMLSYDAFCGIYLSAISQEVLNLIRIMCSETRLPYLPGANELTNLSQEQNGGKPLGDNFKNIFFNQYVWISRRLSLDINTLRPRQIGCHFAEAFLPEARFSQMCKTPLVKIPIVKGQSTLTIKVKFNFKVQIYPILSLSASHHNLSPVQTRFTKFGPKVQNTLVNIPIVFVGRLTLTFEVKFE